MLCIGGSLLKSSAIEPRQLIWQLDLDPAGP